AELGEALVHAAVIGPQRPPALQEQDLVVVVTTFHGVTRVEGGLHPVIRAAAPRANALVTAARRRLPGEVGGGVWCSDHGRPVVLPINPGAVCPAAVNGLRFARPGARFLLSQIKYQ